MKLYDRCGQIRNDLASLIERRSIQVELSPIYYHHGDDFSQNLVEFDSSSWDKVSQDFVWGTSRREVTWFDLKFQVPEELKSEQVVILFDTDMGTGWEATNPQFTVYIDGKIRQALDTNHRYCVLTEDDYKGEHRLSLRAYSGEDDGRTLKMKIFLAVHDKRVEKFFWDFSVPYNTLALLNPDSEDYLNTLDILNDSVNLLDLRKPYSPEFYEALEEANRYLDEHYYKALCDSSKEPVVKAVGHTHIDVAWLWTLKTTSDKAVRSFATVLELMRHYDDYIFMSSQAQLYDYVLHHSPELFKEIQERVKEGRWEVEGGMWVEADCNLSSGEGLVRQFLYGQRFFKEHFGVDNKILWLPDVFGYSAALPQIIKRSGLEYFMTTKIAWNDTNRMPCDTFEWKGIDGTSVLTHFSPSREYSRLGELFPTEIGTFTTYNAMLNETQVKGAWQRYGNKELNSEVLMSYGWGDGGGGTTPEMIERGRRMRHGIKGLPRVEFSSARAFFDKLKSDVEGSKHLPVWDGELYFEYHRATLTSMARNKRDNRRSELRLADMEMLYTLASKFGLLEYPKEKFVELWRIVLRNQFHDILPGSSIEDVYKDSAKEYEYVFSEIAKLRDNALVAIASNSKKHSNDEELIVFNYNSSSNSNYLRLESNISELMSDNSKEGSDASFVLQAIEDNDMSYPEIKVQRTADGAYIAKLDQAASKGFSRYCMKKSSQVESNPKLGTACELPVTIENDYLRLVINEKGRFSSFYDKTVQRELIIRGKEGNRIVSHQTKPHAYDCWDLNSYYKEKFWEIDSLQSAEIVEDGSLRSALKLTYKYQDSIIEEYIYLYHDAARVDLSFDVDWKEHQQMLKLYFPVDIHSHEATYEIQYGHVKRATHYNTSWDRARFEVCCHKWLDFAEDNYGVAVINDSKFGVGIHDQEIGLTMLKAGIYPNPNADIEKHHFAYSIRPHRADFRQASIIDAAYSFNNPAEYIVISDNEATGSNELPLRYELAATDNKNVVVEVVKKSEDGDDDIIRVYEAFGRRSRTRLEFACDYTSVEEVSMSEDSSEYIDSFKEITELSLDKNGINFIIRPFEIKTFRCKK